MALYKVKGEEGAEVEILGAQQAVGVELEFEADVAAPLVEEGKLEAVEAAAG